MKKITLSLILLTTTFYIFRPNNSNNCSKILPPISKQSILDSSKFFIMEAEIYEVMYALFDNFSKTSNNRNVVDLLPFIPKLDETGFSLKSQIIFNLFIEGEGTSQFYVSKEDLKYIREQVLQFKGLIWDVSKLKRIKYDSIMQSIYQTPFLPNVDDWKRKGKIGCFESFGLPLFNKSRDKCTVFISSVCNGLLGSGTTYFLEKKNCRWQLVGHIKNWIS